MAICDEEGSDKKNHYAKHEFEPENMQENTFCFRKTKRLVS